MMADAELFAVILAGIVTASLPLMLAALGELVVEKAGVLNLGVEGMMLVGAVSGFAAAQATGAPLLAGVPAAAVAGMGMALLFGVLTQSLLANQVATGLALTLFGTGLSALVGNDLVGWPLTPIAPVPWPEALTGLPILGPLLFGYDPLVYAGFGMAGLIGWFLFRTRKGLILRAVGENPMAAHTLGHPVLAIRYAALAFGGALAGLGGAYLSLVYTPMWAESMTAGSGWIALALVVFAAWRPGRVVLGALLFGGVMVGQLHAQGAGWNVPSQVMAMTPYLATILVLVLISGSSRRMALKAPAALGRPFDPAA